MLRGIVSWITPGNKRNRWEANLGAPPDRPIGVEIVEGKKRTQPASRGAPGSKLCLNVATIKEPTTQYTTHHPGPKLCLNVATIKEPTTQYTTHHPGPKLCLNVATMKQGTTNVNQKGHWQQKHKIKGIDLIIVQESLRDGSLLQSRILARVTDVPCDSELVLPLEIHYATLLHPSSSS